MPLRLGDSRATSAFTSLPAFTRQRQSRSRDACYDRAVASGDELDDLDGLPHTALTPVKPGWEDELRRGSLQMVVIGNGTFATHPLPDASSVAIGRSPRCEIAVDDESISRRHAMLNLGERVTIEDLGSVNGTRVRGNKIKPGRAVAISVGELIGLGTVSIILQQRSRPVRARRLWTHDYFEARLEEECAREERSSVPFALLHIHCDRRVAESFVEETLGELVATPTSSASTGRTSTR
jgi:hypothetical protein